MKASSLLHLFGFALILGISPAQAAPAYQSHPPQRPLPVPLQAPLQKGPAFFVDAARGDDSADGSKEKPWKTIQHGADRLKPGETLYLRGGVYYEKVRLTRSGMTEAPIVVASYPGELAVVDGGLAEFAAAPEKSWEPAKGGVDGEYVSTKAYEHVDDRVVPNQFLPASWEPMWGIEDERPLALGHFADSMTPLHGYRNLRDLEATSEFKPAGKGTATGVYCGPGLWFNRETGRIHIRLAHSQLPGLGERAYRGETDPRKLQLVVAAGFGQALLRANGIRHVQVQGIVLRGGTGSPMLEVYGSEKLRFDHLSIFGGFPGVLINASKDIQLANSAIRGLAAPWTGRSQMKYSGTATYAIVLQNNQPENENIEISWCELTDGHDCAFFRYVKNLQFHHNLVDNFNDDGLECGPKRRSHTIFLYQNRIGPCLGVLQQHEGEKDESPTTHDPNSGVYVFRNVFDQRGGVYYQHPGSAEPDRQFLHDQGVLISDHGSPIYSLYRFYQNTVLRKTPVRRDAFFIGLTMALAHTERDIFNNIFVQNEKLPPITISPGRDAGPLREGGNLVWGLQNDAQLGDALLAKFRASPVFATSKQTYEPGWTTQDRIADPKFVALSSEASSPTDLRLQPGSPAIKAGLPLPADWPDPLRPAAQEPPDSGAIPHGTEPWTVGIDGRISLFSGEVEKK
jgi:hypothetical protein